MKLSELIRKTGINDKSLKRYLKTLLELGIINVKDGVYSLNKEKWKELIKEGKILEYI